jgi:hypothetical protein
MKKLTVLIVLALTGLYAFAQDEFKNDELRTVFSNPRVNGAYGAFTIGYTQIDGRDGLISGARAGVIIDHAFAIGLGGYGFVNNIDYHTYINNDLPEYTLAGGYGGLFVEPIIAGSSPVHLSFPVFFGIGGVALLDDSGDHWDNEYFDVDNDVFFVVEPAVELEFNLTRFFRTALAASYRHTSNLELYQTDPDVLRGFNFGITFKFGKF